jgi:Ni/Fe-hydrogenase subunit HybB-like protein
MTTLHPDEATAKGLAGLRPGYANHSDVGDGTLIDDPAVRAPLVLGGLSFHDVTETVCSYAEKGPGKWWLPATLMAASIASLTGLMVGYLIITGVGVWGLTNQVDWAWDITNFVFWIGIGHAGTLISAILCLLKQKWRTAVNRSAEAMTIFAVICAGMFPGIHVGRVWMAWMLGPIPNYNYIWPNFRSPLLWDVFAVSTYATVSALFWYMGMIPDVATLRDRADRRLRAAAAGGPAALKGDKIRTLVYGLLSIGWRFSGRHWHRYEAAYLILAGISTPLVLSVHSIVSFDFATSVVPGWHTTIFPPYFVAGAIFGGFAMVLFLLIPARELFPGMKNLLTLRHLENMAKILLLTGSMVGFAYAMEFFIAWYGANDYEKDVFINRATGPYWWAYWTMISCNVIFLVSIAVTVGMWFERFVIIVSSLHRAFLPGEWHMFHPTLVDILTFVGSCGVFLTLFLLFTRFLPIFAIAELKAVMPEASPHHHGDAKGAH